MAVEREALRDGVRIRDGRGVLTVRRPAPHVELIRCEGYGRRDHLDFVIASRDRILREEGRIAIFDDLVDLRGYDSEVRTRLTAWSRAHRGSIVAFHILLRSKIVAMGVSLANAAIGGNIEAHTDRAPFEAALAREIAHKRGRLTA
jgi:hypothetical protein